MAMKNPFQTYQQNAVTTSSPQELTLMLYNGCIKFIRLSAMAMEKKNIEAKNTNIIKAQNILQELRGSLNMEIELSESMDSLYEYMISQLVSANINNDASKLKEVEELAEEFRNTWKTAMEQMK
ncbi:flagellar export chaperone FliS [Pseudalkalibacillus hwajinpoensis]|uniref:Flagellar export chaperone FliS n=1 Tax=Guptibacillus hwajinpoensis TaxID=208199 RepID=A0A4U1MJF4_9BACL|nr:flagellar export chaperone FliS [Pseudalkalibacillus hwajinpoensis]TKD70530.1 flagellar export chaperone FliS [Pseudalkalibacillus hwajinpoensis]